MLSLLQGGQNLLHALAGTLVTQDPGDGVQVGGVGLAGDGLAEHGGHIGHGALIGGGIGLIFSIFTEVNNEKIKL